MRNNLIGKICKSIIGAFLVLGLLACNKQNKLDVYSCSLQRDSIGCSSGCVKDKDTKYSFLVNKEDKSVLHIVYFEGVQDGSVTHKNCTIFSTENWDCSEISDASYVTYKFHTKMTNGVFSWYEEKYDINGRPLESINKDGTCAK